MGGLGVLLIADIYMGAFSLVPTVWAWCDTTPKMGGPLKGVDRPSAHHL